MKKKGGSGNKSLLPGGPAFKQLGLQCGASDPMHETHKCLEKFNIDQNNKNTALSSGGGMKGGTSNFCPPNAPPAGTPLSISTFTSQSAVPDPQPHNANTASKELTSTLRSGGTNACGDADINNPAGGSKSKRGGRRRRRKSKGNRKRTKSNRKKKTKRTKRTKSRRRRTRR